MNTSKFPVIVAGAGIVGMAMCLRLNQCGIKAALIAPHYKPKANLGEQYHPRIYAISLTSQQLLAQLGIWDLLPAQRMVSVQNMQIYGDLDAELNLAAWSANQAQLAWIVESGEIEAALQKALRFVAATWVDAAVRSYHASASDEYTVLTDTGESYRTQLVIGAEGANSVLRQVAGIAHQVRSYESRGLVAQLSTEHAHLETAYQWFIDEGILAFLPLPDHANGHQVSMVWSAPEAIAQSILALEPAAQAVELRTRLGLFSQGKLGSISLRSPVLGFPLSVEQSAMIAPGVALIGDAAHRVHPLAGQGLNLGLADVRVLAQILDAKEHFRGYGDFRLLSRYRTARSRDVLEMQWVTDGLQKLFSARHESLALLRNTGLGMVQQLPALKRLLIKKAAGL